MRVTAEDGTVFEGASAKEVIEAMRRDQWSAVESMDDYVAGVQERVREMVGVEVRIDTPENLLDDLVSAGVLVYGDASGRVAGDGDEGKP